MKLGDYYEGYYKGYMRYLAPGTAQGYDGDWRNHIAGEFGGWEMEDIRVRHINAWLASDHFAGVPGAARSAYKTLRQILRSAMGDELYSNEVVDPTTRGIRLPPMDTGYEAPYLRPSEFREMVLGLMGFEYDIDLRTGIVLIERGLQVIGGEVVETKVKTHRSKRPHMLPRSGVMRLREIKRGLGPRPAGWLLGEDPNPDRYARRLRAWCKRRGLPYVAPKYFRHTFRTLHAMAGTDETEVQKMLGHESLGMGYRYMSLDEDVLREDQAAYERLILRA